MYVYVPLCSSKELKEKANRTVPEHGTEHVRRYHGSRHQTARFNITEKPYEAERRE